MARMGGMNVSDAQGEVKESKVKSPTRQTRVWGTQIRFRIYRPGHPPCFLFFG
jgi:hypothetical protein